MRRSCTRQFTACHAGSCMHYTACDMRRRAFSTPVGAAVRAQRERRGWSRRELAVAQRRLRAVPGPARDRRRQHLAAPVRRGRARARHDAGGAARGAADAPAATSRSRCSACAARASPRSARRSRSKLGVPFVELDQRDRGTRPGCPLGEVFALHGEAYYRRVEREVLGARARRRRRRWCSRPAARSSTTRPTTRCCARAAARSGCARTPEDHWNRVVAQGDQRPMAENPHAFAELRALLAARAKLYARADHTIETSGRTGSRSSPSSPARCSGAVAPPHRGRYCSFQV